jgi:hypothetical protein
VQLKFTEIKDSRVGSAPQSLLSVLLLLGHIQACVNAADRYFL